MFQNRSTMFDDLSIFLINVAYRNINSIIKCNTSLANSNDSSEPFHSDYFGNVETLSHQSIGWE